MINEIFTSTGLYIVYFIAIITLIFGCIKDPINPTKSIISKIMAAPIVIPFLIYYYLAKWLMHYLQGRKTYSYNK